LPSNRILQRLEDCDVKSIRAGDPYGEDAGAT